MMNAGTAAELTKTHKELNRVFEDITYACKRGETYIQPYQISDAVKTELVDLGYYVQAEVDDDSNLKGYMISWASKS